MFIKHLIFVITLSNVFFVDSFVYYKSNVINNLKMRFSGDISRRNILELIPSTIAPVIIHPKYVLAFKDTINKNEDNINKVAVFGASGYTGGDTIRTLINNNINVLAITCRNSG